MECQELNCEAAKETHQYGEFPCSWNYCEEHEAVYRNGEECPEES
jgi:hypothetical protein